MPRYRKPREVRALDGTFRKDRHSNPVLDGSVTPLGDPPKWLSKVGRDKWEEMKRLAPWMDNALYAAGMEEFCHLYHLKVLEARGKGALSSTQLVRYGQLQREMGLTPATRGKVALPPPVKQKADDPWSELKGETTSPGRTDTPVQ